MQEPTAPDGQTRERPPNPPGRIWAIGVLVLSALVSMSMNTVHAFEATTLPAPLALMYGIAPVALAAMQSHAVALRALRKEEVGVFRKILTFALVIGGLGLSFLGIYDLLRHAVPDPIPAVPIHEPAVFFSIVIDLMALAALHELLRESPSLVSAVQAAEATVPATVVETATVEAERPVEVPAAVEPIGSLPAPAIAEAAGVPVPVPAVPVLVEPMRDVKDDILHHLDDEPAFSDQVQPERADELDAPYRPVALAKFLPEVASGEPPTVRTIKERMGVGTDRARRLQTYLGGLVEVSR